MSRIALRESMVRASELVRHAWERRAQIIIPRWRQPASPPLPLSDADLPVDDLSNTTPWQDVSRLGEDIGRGWRSRLTGTGLVSRMRH